MDALQALIAAQKQKVAAMSFSQRGSSEAGPAGKSPVEMCSSTTVLSLHEKKSTGGSGWIQRGKVAERLRAEAERRALEEERKRRRGETERLKELAEHLDEKKRRTNNAAAQNDGPHPAVEQPVHDLEGKEEAQPPLAKSDVVKKLRRLKEPITLFGETDWQRYTRLCQLELLHHEDELMGGQRNAFLNPQDDDEEEELDEDDAHHKGGVGDGISSRRESGLSSSETATSSHAPRAVSGEDGAAAAGRGAQDVAGGEAEGGSGRASKHDSSADQAAPSGVSESSHRQKVYSKETVVVRWIRRMLHEWEAELKARTEDAKNSAEGRFMTSLHRQTRKDVKPLLKKLKRKELEEDIRDKLYDMVLCCEERKYRSAHDTFLLLSIGNAAWPVGVTMVGIHERVGRSKLYTSQVAHILNDETTRKYIQMFKRLISFCQRRYPADPSQTISLSTVHI